MKKDGNDQLPADQKGNLFMVESAPLFIEYCCQGYVNCDTFNAVIAILLICCFASWIGAYILLRRALAEILPDRT